MKTTCGLALAATLVLLVVAPMEGRNNSKKNQPAVAQYTLDLATADIWDILDINNKEAVLIERQLADSAPPVPLIIHKSGKETSAVQCPGTTNDTTGEGLNDRGDIVGHCGHDAKAPGLFAFVANPKRGSLFLLSYPGAQTTWGYGINDFGQVVGFYANAPQPPFCCNLPPRNLHAFVWDAETDQYFTIDNPLAEPVGGWTFIHGINNKGQMVGHYNTLKNVSWEEYQFLYDNGTFTPIEFPGAYQTHISGINNLGQILGWSDRTDGCSSLCPFLYDDGSYLAIRLPLPANAPRPDGVPAGAATLNYLGGLNDEGQFVGTYSQVLEWDINMFGDLAPSRMTRGRFVATPQRARKK